MIPAKPPNHRLLLFEEFPKLLAAYRRGLRVKGCTESPTAAWKLAMSNRFPKRPRAQESPLSEVRENACRRLRGLLGKLADKEPLGEEFSDLDALLLSLSLPSEAIAAARRRLAAAQRFLRSNEVGAARYELRLLLGELEAEG